MLHANTTTNFGETTRLAKLSNVQDKLSMDECKDRLSDSKQSESSIYPSPTLHKPH